MARNGQRTQTRSLDHVQTAFTKGVPLWRARWVSPDAATGAPARHWKAELPAAPSGYYPSRLEAEVCR